MITGGMGFIGSHLARELVRRGWTVKLVDNLSTGRVSNVEDLRTDARVRMMFMDVADRDALEPAMEGCQAVFHLAAAVGVDYVMNHPVETIHANVAGTEAVLKAAAKRGLPVMIASTSEVYGKATKLPFSEEDDVVLGPTSRHRWSYAASKMIDEFLALALAAEGSVPAVVFRLFNTVGPRQTGRYGMVVPRFVEAALSGSDLEVYGDGTQTRCFLHVHDAVEAIIALAECPNAVGEVFNIGAPDPVSIHRLAELVIEKAAKHKGGSTGAGIVFRRPEEVLGPGYEDVHDRIPDISKIQRFTGWAPTRTLDDILEDVVADLARNGQLDHVNPPGPDRRLSPAGTSFARST
jgi:UDP-glucose 4-epimerase